MAPQRVDKISSVTKAQKRSALVAPHTSEQDVPNAAHGSILRLQRLVGNQATQRMISGGFVQTKMNVNAPGDIYEQQADQVAEQVMTMSDTVQLEELPEDELMAKRNGAVQREELPEDELMAKRNGAIQREELPEDELMAKRDAVQREELPEDELMAKRDAVQREELPEDELMAKSDADIPAVMPDVEAKINQGRGAGQTLPDNARTFFELRFGQDFSNVRIHADSESDDLNRSLEARAFTNQGDIYFRDGEYQPDSSAGRELLAHELTHVVQQGASVQKSEDSRR